MKGKRVKDVNHFENKAENIRGLGHKLTTGQVPPTLFPHFCLIFWQLASDGPTSLAVHDTSHRPDTSRRAFFKNIGNDMIIACRTLVMALYFYIDFKGWRGKPVTVRRARLVLLQRWLRSAFSHRTQLLRSFCRIGEI